MSPDCPKDTWKFELYIIGDDRRSIWLLKTCESYALIISAAIVMSM